MAARWSIRACAKFWDWYRLGWERPPNSMQSYDVLYVFMLAAFLGFELVKRVSPLLHTPLMSLSNAISAIAVVGGILVTGDTKGSSMTHWLGFIAIIAA